MSQEGLIDGVVCLNHDGLLQKAGCPQEAVLEVHGSWFDPANPALRPGGQVRPDIWRRSLALLDRADLCVVIGTSLSGLDTDLIVETAARSCGLGLVIINLQQTRLDGEAALRISSEADTVMERLAVKLRLRFSVPKVVCCDYCVSSIIINYVKFKISHRMKTHALIPYDKDGFLSDRSHSCLDLTKGQQIKLLQHHNSKVIM